MNSTTLPPIPIALDLDTKLQFLGEDQRLHLALREEVEAHLDTVLSALGIPGHPCVALTYLDVPQGIRVRVHGQELPYSRFLFAEVWRTIAISDLGTVPAETSWQNWAAEDLRAQGPAPAAQHPDMTVAFIAQLAVEVLKRRPERLLHTAQAQCYLELAKQAVPEAIDVLERLTPELLLRMLGPVLALGISIGELSVVVSTMHQGLSHERPPSHIAESLITRLRPGHAEIQAHPAYLRHLFATDLATLPLSVHDARAGAEANQVFAMMSDGLFYELGIRVPDIRLVGSFDLKEGVFAIRLNHLTGMARHGLRLGQILANKAPQALNDELGLPATESANPANDNPCALTDAQFRDAIEGAGIITWTPVGYLVLAMAREVRDHAAFLVDSELVEFELAQLHQAFPELILSTLHTISLWDLTRVMRGLIHEEVAIRDLRSILERLVAFDDIVADTRNRLVLDDRLAVEQSLGMAPVDHVEHLLQYVRIGCKRYLAHKYSRGTNTLRVYLLDPELEQQLVDHLASLRGDAEKSPLSTETLEELRAAIRLELGDIKPQAMPPQILTIGAIRGLLRSIVQDEFPKLAVLAYEELPHDVNIQPLARISLQRSGFVVDGSDGPSMRLPPGPLG